MVSLRNWRKAHRLSPSVRAVPARENQRTASSLPLGKKTSSRANSAGVKITSDIRIRSYSGGIAISKPTHCNGWAYSSRRGHQVGQEGEKSHRRHHQEKNVTS